MKNPFSTRSEMGIRKRILFLLLVVFVPLLLLQVFTFYRWYLDSKESEMQANLELARTVSKTFGTFINDILNTQLAIGLAATASPPPSNDSLRRILKATEEMNPMFRSLSWISPEGISLVTTNPETENRGVRQRNLFQRIMAGEEYGVSELYDSPYTGDRVFSIGRGIRDPKGNLLGVVLFVCVAEKLDSLLAVPRSKNAGISLIDIKGIHVYRYPATKYSPEQSNWLKLYPIIGEALKGKEVVADFESKLTGMKRLVAFVPIPSISWVASCSRSEEETIAGIFETLLPQAMLILIVALATFGAAATLSRPISASIRRLQNHAAALGRGEVERLETPLGPREIRNLADTFNDMAERVRLREQALRQKEADLNEAQRIAHIGSWYWNVQTDITTGSDEFLRIFGLDPATTKSLTFKEQRGRFVSADDWDRLNAAVQKTFLIGGSYEVDAEVIRPDGTRIWTSARGEIVRDSQGQVVGLRGTLQDISERKQAEESVAAAHIMIQSIVDNTTSIVYAFDLEERFLLANTALAELLNSTPEQMIGKRRHEFMPKDDADWHEANDRRVIETGRALEFEEQSRLKGRSITWLTTKFPLRDAQGRIYALGGISADVSERKRAEEALRESEERLKLTLQSSAVGTFEIDLTTGVGRWNAVEYELLGLRPGDAPSDPETFFRYVHPQDVAELRARWEEATRIGRFAAEFRVRRADGQERWLAGKGKFAFTETEDAGSAGEKRSPLRFLGVNFDITERKHAEEELERHRQHLEGMVQERTAELERKNRELQEFAFVAAHDLSEPLRKIQTFGDLLKAKSADHLNDQDKDYVSRMTGAASRMQELLDALLRYSRVDTKGQEFRPVKLDDIVRDSVTDLEVSIQKIGARVEIGPLPSIIGDPLQLRQLFQNLIANSLKYYRSEVTPFVGVHGEENDNACRIFVEDHGIGFDERYLDKIFQPFQRLHGRNEYSGLGMGLAICRKIVARHRGTITASSTLGKGSTFIVTLPVNGTNAMNKSE